MATAGDASLNGSGVANDSLATVDDQLAREIAHAAEEMARGAGEILLGHFGRSITVEYKDESQKDPVTSADKASQEFLSSEIAKRFPEHGILGEEGADEAEADTPAPDFVWVLDPLDGTTNFLNGLPLYAASIGVLHRGTPIAGALFIPWPNSQGGFVLHCRRGHGCFADGEPVSVYQADEPANNRLAGLPGYFPYGAKFGSRLRGKTGDMRVTGSIAYELAMTARGSLQYSIIGACHMWDMLAGALAVMEARGTVMTRLGKEKRWHPLESLTPDWDEKRPSMKDLRNWRAPLVAGGPKVAPLIAENIRPRFMPLARLGRLGRKLRRMGKQRS